MMPKFTFMGWNFTTLSSLMNPANAPSAVQVGKSTGGFCASPYGKGSFILLSWNNRMADVFTLAHELGHAGHFRLCNGAQAILDTEVSSYFVRRRLP